MAFSPDPSLSWSVDALTTDYLLSGEVEQPEQKWGWTYFCVTEPRRAEALRMRITGVHPTSGQAPLAWVGAHAAFGYRTSLVALLPRNDSANAMWDQWN